MDKIGFHISLNELNKIFPFYLILSDKLVVEFFGKSIPKLWPTIAKGDSFVDLWSITVPKMDIRIERSLEGVLGKLCVIEKKSKAGFGMKGHFEKIGSENKYIFYGNPSFTSTNQIIENNLTLNDFSLNDTTFDLLHVLKTNEIANEELKELLQKINEQKKDLSLFKQIIDSSSDAIQVAYESGRLFYINQVASDRLGIPMEEVRNYFVSDFEEVFQIVPKAWEKHLQEVKSKDLLMLEGFNVNQLTKEKFPVEVTAKHVNLGGKELIIAISRDISERTEHQKILALQQEKFQNIISNMNLGLLEVDKEDKVLFCNQSFERMSGYTLKEIVGKEARTILMGDEGQELIQEKNKSRQKGESDSYEVQVFDKNSEAKLWLISGAPNYNDEGELIGSIGIHLDITEQKKLENELAVAYETSKQAAQAKEAFLANMSHEIRTPLNAIIGMIRELSREKMTAKQQGFLRHTDSAANHLLSIVNSILDMSKIEAGEFELDEHNFSLPALIGNIQSILTGKAKRKHLDLSTQIDPRISTAHIGDGPRLRQIFINLMDNSIKFTERGSIELKAELLTQTKYNQKIRFEISDTGIGMDEKFLSEIFSKFSQAEKSTSRRFGGTGLGMAITRELIQIMGGDIKVESKKGVGTQITIELTLPIGDPAELKTEGNKVEKNALKGVRILLVEDNEMNRFIALQSLQFLGCAVDEAENGLIALEKLNTGKYDVILMDIQMPEMDGVTTTQNIRGQLQMDIPIIAVTANAFKEDIDLYLNVGMNDFVTKPFEEYKLYASIAKVLKVNKENTTVQVDEEVLRETDKGFDLSKLHELSHGNEDFVVRMTQIFKESTPVSLLEMREGLYKRDYMLIAKMAHKLKPSIESMGIHRLEGKAKELELECKEEIIDHKSIEKKVVFFINEVEAVIEKL